MTRSQRKALTVPSTAKVGDDVSFNGAPFLIRLPDGTVVSGRDSYHLAHAGKHVAVVAGKEYAVDVAGAAKTDPKA